MTTVVVPDIEILTPGYEKPQDEQAGCYVCGDPYAPKKCKACKQHVCLEHWYPLCPRISGGGLCHTSKADPKDPCFLHVSMCRPCVMLTRMRQGKGGPVP